jgi:hypothetical protein
MQGLNSSHFAKKRQTTSEELLDLERRLVSFYYKHQTNDKLRPPATCAPLGNSIAKITSNSTKFVATRRKIAGRDLLQRIDLYVSCAAKIGHPSPAP